MAQFEQKTFFDIREFFAGCVISAVNYVLFFCVSIVIARWLGAARFGDYSVAVAAATVCAAVVTLGLEKLSLKKLPIFKSHQEWDVYRGFLVRGVQLTFLTGVALIVLFLVGALSYAILAVGPELHRPLVLSILFIPIMGLVAFLAEVLNVNGGYVASTAITRLLLPVCLLAGLALFKVIFARFSTEHAILAVGASWWICLVAAIALLWKKLPRIVLMQQPRFDTRAWLLASYAFAINTLLLLSIQKSVVLTLEAAHWSQTIVGTYAAAAQAASFITVFVLASNRYFLPRIAQPLEERDATAVNILLRKRFFALTVLSLLICVPILIFGKSILYLFSPEFVDAYPTLFLLAIASFAQSLLAICPMLWQFMGHGAMVMKAYGSALATVIVGTAVLGNLFGLMGAALAYSLPITGALVYLERRMRREHGLYILPFRTVR